MPSCLRRHHLRFRRRMKSPLLPLLLSAPSCAFVPRKANPGRCNSVRLHERSDLPLHLMVFEQPQLLEDDEEMIPIAEAYIHAKYKCVASSHGHSVATKDDVREVLHSILPPVTPEELEREELSILQELLKRNGPETLKTGSESPWSDDFVAPILVDEDNFVKSIMQNSYWREAGDIVVKELIYFDCLHSYYKTGKPLLSDEHYDALHENLTWEGSSVATMSAKEVQFVSAVAASKRGEPLMDDGEYAALKSELKKEGSWVVNRGEDALERIGLNTFMGYLHRSLA